MLGVSGCGDIAIALCPPTFTNDAVSGRTTKATTNCKCRLYISNRRNRMFYDQINSAVVVLNQLAICLGLVNVAMKLELGNGATIIAYVQRVHGRRKSQFTIVGPVKSALTDVTVTRQF